MDCTLLQHFEKITRMTFPLGDDNLIFVSLGSDTVRTDLHEGGQKQIIEHVTKHIEQRSYKTIT